MKALHDGLTHTHIPDDPKACITAGLLPLDAMILLAVLLTAHDLSHKNQMTHHSALLRNEIQPDNIDL